MLNREAAGLAQLRDDWRMHADAGRVGIWSRLRGVTDQALWAVGTPNAAALLSGQAT